MRIVAPSARWLAAAICLLYGFAKVNGAQFTVLDSELARPLGEVSGFWLTWHYFGYSRGYGAILAILQIGGGILLLVPRTSLAAALLLLPVAANIVLVDIFYGVDAGGTLAALVLLASLLLIIAPHRRPLIAAVLPQRPSPRPILTTAAAVSALTLAAFGATWWIANYNNRVPTPIDGIWMVVSQEGTAPGHPRWRHVFFERNRARLVVFRSEEGEDRRHHFEIEGSAVQVWETWLRKGPLLMRGSRVGESEIALEVVAERGGGRLVLRRVPATGAA